VSGLRLTPEVETAYRHCEAVTKQRAANFYYGIRLLAPRQRAAMCALYAIARRIDDLGDGEAPAEDKLAWLADTRKAIAGIAADPATAGHDPVLVALADAGHRFGLPWSALEELIEGCEWDVTGRRYEDIDDLVAYCRRVAGTIGRLSLAVYGSDDPTAAAPLADALGVALQLTNILRDVVEDRDGMGRQYLPAADRRRFGVADDLSGPDEGLMALICFESARAEAWYDEGLQLLDHLDWRSRACTAAMAGIYRRLLDVIRADPAAVLSRRLSLSPAAKGAVALRALAVGRA
jgi:phytoene synthase